MRVPANPFVQSPRTPVSPTHELSLPYVMPLETKQALEDATHEMLLDMPALPTGAVMCDVCGCGIGAPLWTNDHPSVVCMCGDVEPEEPMCAEAPVQVAFLGMTFEAPRPSNPFSEGALLPLSVETLNSRYEVYEHAWRADEDPMCTVTCIRGTFAGEFWLVRTVDVTLTRTSFMVDGDAGLRTTTPTKVNGYPVETWA